MSFLRDGKIATLSTSLLIDAIARSRVDRPRVAGLSNTSRSGKSVSMIVRSARLKSLANRM